MVNVALLTLNVLHCPCIPLRLHPLPLSPVPKSRVDTVGRSFDPKILEEILEEKDPRRVVYVSGAHRVVRLLCRFVQNAYGVPLGTKYQLLTVFLF